MKCLGEGVGWRSGGGRVSGGQGERRDLKSEIYVIHERSIYLSPRELRMRQSLYRIKVASLKRSCTGTETHQQRSK
ncbi:hypothetical protein PDE_01487 [Penicillium oxalicum 114-2]|uniref:Uncharacterized protein n=1 Tax=Penicillium oxalicum (strain 114-2 / CGMCC 5302) TaxID=933388 RepID=S7Z7J9_PENO1|nr:hypothetical protein PDE_01487 [Penicillium oxalicum 114-2]